MLIEGVDWEIGSGQLVWDSYWIKEQNNMLCLYKYEDNKLLDKNKDIKNLSLFAQNHKYQNGKPSLVYVVNGVSQPIFIFDKSKGYNFQWQRDGSLIVSHNTGGYNYEHSANVSLVFNTEQEAIVHYNQLRVDNINELTKKISFISSYNPKVYCPFEEWKNREYTYDRT